MDPDVFPNSIEYWGPDGMVFFRNVQLRWTPWQDGDSRFAVAIERPGASADGGVYADRIELQDVKARFPLPDFTAQFRYSKGWGHIQLAGIIRKMDWDDLSPGPIINLTGGATGWGFNLSSNIKIDRHVARLQVVYGHGMENYMNDAPIDVGIQNNFSSLVQPVIGVPLPCLGIVAFMDFNWSPKWTSTAGYSMVNITNSDAELPSDFHKGQYALANILYYPVPNFFLGPEVQYVKRNNFADGFSSDDVRIQFSAKYSFKHTFGGK